MDDHYRHKYHKWKRLYINLKKEGNLGKNVAPFIIQNAFPIIKDIDRDDALVLDQYIRKMAGNDGTKMISDPIE